eukprot:Sspe_Gene.72820::Locus_43625_Transcript_1_1_Confidence_1.000_Length_1284::g.72820::m.72820/K15731/CTDSP; carboxy-terminal domain RNA polymerase II polypeptide A small phosphatase
MLVTRGDAPHSNRMACRITTARAYAKTVPVRSDRPPLGKVNYRKLLQEHFATLDKLERGERRRGQQAPPLGPRRKGALSALVSPLSVSPFPSHLPTSVGDDDYLPPKGGHSIPAMHPSPEDVHLSGSKKLLVVLDLDETLVFARMGPVLQRPGVGSLLTALKGANCEVIVWTAGTCGYAFKAIRAIDPQGVITHCIHRSPQWYSLNTRKDLRRLRGYPLSRMVLVENSPECCRPCPSNSIIVPSYLHPNPRDDTLRRLSAVLTALASSDSPVPEGLQKIPGTSSSDFPLPMWGGRLKCFTLS